MFAQPHFAVFQHLVGQPGGLAALGADPVSYTHLFLDPSSLQSMVSQTGSMLGYIDILTGGAFAKATIFRCV